MVYFNEQMLYSASNELINDFVEEIFSRPFEQKMYDYVLFLAVFNAVRLIFRLNCMVICAESELSVIICAFYIYSSSYEIKVHVSLYHYFKLDIKIRHLNKITAYLSFTIRNVISEKETAEHFMVGEEYELMCRTFMNDLMTVLSNLLLLHS